LGIYYNTVPLYMFTWHSNRLLFVTGTYAKPY
jgi:hypothetical protein